MKLPKDWCVEPRTKQWSGPHNTMICEWVDEKTLYRFGTYFQGKPANNGTCYKSFNEAREHLQAWIRNTSEHEMKEKEKLSKVEL